MLHRGIPVDPIGPHSREAFLFAYEGWLRKGASRENEEDKKTYRMSFSMEGK
jgi:hypothetical protein